MEILAQSSTAFVLKHNFQGTHILGASRGRLSDSVASCSVFTLVFVISTRRTYDFMITSAQVKVSLLFFRNLEYMALARKRKGWKLQHPTREYYHR